MDFVQDAEKGTGLDELTIEDFLCKPIQVGHIGYFILKTTYII